MLFQVISVILLSFCHAQGPLQWYTFGVLTNGHMCHFKAFCFMTSCFTIKCFHEQNVMIVHMCMCVYVCCFDLISHTVFQ